MRSAGVELEALRVSDLPALARLWNASGALGAAHPLTQRVLEQWWASPDTDPALCWAARRRGVLQGAVVARAPRRRWSDPHVGYLSLLVVAAAARGQGLGETLWETACAGMRERGRSLLRLGTDPDHLLPGVPGVTDDAAWRFMLARGVVPGGLEADVLVDLRLPEAGRLPPHGTLHLVDDDPGAALAFVGRCFPGRWADDVARYAAAGTTLLTLREGGATLAFAAVFRQDDTLLGPSLTWASALPGPVGGIGPLGVDPTVRGRGLGLRLVAEALDWHRVRGAREVVLDWTSLTGFYGRLGARVWRTYQRAEVALGPLRSAKAYSPLDAQPSNA